MSKKTRGYLLIATAGILWGTVGLFVTKLLEAQLPIHNIVFYRMLFAFFTLFLFLFFTNRNCFKIDRSIFKYTMPIGLISLCLFNFCYFTAIQMTSIATAVTLLHTVPLFIAFLTRIFFHELFTKNKVLALILQCLGSYP